MRAQLERNPEKCEAVFRKIARQNKKLEQNCDSVIADFALEAGRFSRRRFVEFGAASLLATQAALAQSIAPLPPGVPQDDAARVAAATDPYKHMTVPVMINGKGPFYFVVDTGADRTVIADDVAIKLGLIRGNDVTVQGVVRTVSSRLVGVADLSFGTITRRNLALPILPHAFMGADGYLGLDAVDGSRVVLDFNNRELQVAPPRRPTFYKLANPNEAMVPVRGSMGHLRSMNCRVDNISTTCFIDTGAEVSVGNSRLFAALLAGNPNYKILGMLPITGITGGVIMGRVLTINTIRLHSVTFSNAVLAIADMQIFDVWGLSREPSLLIGMNFLRQFSKVSIDYGLKEIRFDLASMMLAQRG
jgi:predicted aspartyl protease